MDDNRYFLVGILSEDNIIDDHMAYMGSDGIVYAEGVEVGYVVNE
jgi:hypothetical protein